jgi:hypothetical protein
MSAGNQAGTQRQKKERAGEHEGFARGAARRWRDIGTPGAVHAPIVWGGYGGGGVLRKRVRHDLTKHIGFEEISTTHALAIRQSRESD